MYQIDITSISRFIRLMALVLFLCLPAFGQNGYVTVVGTVPTYAGGQLDASFVNQSTLPQLPLLNGSVFPTNAVTNLDVNGHFSMALADNTIIQPNPSQWGFILCLKTGNPSQPCYPVTLTITCVSNPSCVGSTLDISSAFSGVPVPPVGPGNLPIATYAGQLLVSQGNSTAYTTLTQIYVQQPSDTISSIESKCTGALLCTYMVVNPQTITLSGNHTLSSNVFLNFGAGGMWTLNGSGTLTIPSQVNGTLTQHFAGTQPVKFGLQQSLVPAEWFGAVANGSTDNCTPIQNALNSLTSGQVVLQTGQYNHSCTFSISSSNVGITGQGMRVTNNLIYSNPHASVLMNTSAGNDSIDVLGNAPSAYIGFNRFDHFDIERNQVPTGTAAGLSLSDTYGVTVESVGIQDSIRNIYVHGTGSQGNGFIQNSVFIWGYNGVTETSGNVYGMYVDSTDGLQSPSFRVRNSFAAANSLTGVNSVGAEFVGTAINDQMFYGFETAGVSYGEYINQTGAGSVIASSDMHFFGTINDGCGVSCFYITGIQLNGGAGVEINGGYDQPAAASPAIDIESSSGVRILGVQFGVQTAANMSACVLVNSSGNILISSNLCQGAKVYGFELNTTSQMAITGNTLIGNNDTGGLISLVNSSYNTIMSNTLSGLGKSMVIDSNSNANAGISLNAISTTLAAATNAGNNPIYNGASNWTPGSGAPSGACANGSLYSNSATTTGSFAAYICRNAVWVGLGTSY